MRVPLRSPAALMAEQLLDVAEVGPVLEQMGGERLAEGVDAARLADACAVPGLLEYFLYAPLGKVLAPVLPGKQPVVGRFGGDVPLNRHLGDIGEEGDAILASFALTGRHGPALEV